MAGINKSYSIFYPPFSENTLTVSHSFVFDLACSSSFVLCCVTGHRSLNCYHQNKHVPFYLQQMAPCPVCLAPKLLYARLNIDLRSLGPFHRFVWKTQRFFAVWKSASNSFSSWAADSLGSAAFSLVCQRQLFLVAVLLLPLVIPLFWQVCGQQLFLAFLPANSWGVDERGMHMCKCSSLKTDLST